MIARRERLPKLPKGRVVAVDTETTGLHPHLGHRVFCIAFMSNRGEHAVLWKTPAAIRWVQRLMSDPDRDVVFHNAKFDLKMLAYDGLDLDAIRANVHCTLILSKLFNFNGARMQHSLAALAPYYLKHEDDDKVEIVKWLKTQNTKAKMRQRGRELNFRDVPQDILRKRVLWDAKSTLFLFAKFYPVVRSRCPDLYATEQALQFVCIDMERRGVAVDLTHARKLEAECRDWMARILHLLTDLCCPVVAQYKDGARTIEADDFNPGSDRHLIGAFEAVGIPLRYRTKTGRWSFNDYAMLRYVSEPVMAVMRESSEQGWKPERFVQALQDAVREHDLPDRELLPPLILRYRTLGKLASTYYRHMLDNAVDRWKDKRGREYGILHCSFNPTEAKTGRFSSSQPNLQNIPRTLGPRECFVPRPGRHWWAIDYEQIEMKMFAHFAKDQHMADAIAEDIHRAVAARIYKVPLDQVTSEQRKRAKAINFGIIYGAGPGKIAETLTQRGLPTSELETARLCANYHHEFPSVRKLTRELETQLVRHGFVRNPFGRMYHIPPAFAYKALNYECQGTSADLMKARMVAVAQWLKKSGYRTRLVLTVHDELVFEGPPKEAEQVVPTIMGLMEDKTSYIVPITVDVEVVRNRWSRKEKPGALGLRLCAA